MFNRDITTRKSRLVSRWERLKSERSSWMSHWAEISRYLLPRNGRYFETDRNRGERRHNSIYDSTGTRSLRTLGAGMMSGATSPARPWFRLATPDSGLNAVEPVKIWLDDVTKRMQMIFQRSNTYRVLHQMYEELGAFGTAASIVLPHYDTVIRQYPMTIGEYAVASDFDGRVCTLYREFQKTVSELVKEFGYANCSQSVRNMADQGNLDNWVTVIHAIEPRADRNPAKADAKNMAWGSYYFEPGGDADKFLRESGFKRFPVVAPRWSVVGGDIYGNSPGMEALGDIKQLQHEQLRKAEVIDFHTQPPLSVPVSLKNRDVNRLPGGITFYTGENEKIEPLFNVSLNLEHLLYDIRDVRERINGAFYADLFLLLANSTDTRMTATEVAERHEEKMLMLGPVLERLHNELLEPLIDITFMHMVEGGAIPPPPEELRGRELNVEFVSMLAQAQRAIGVNSVDRFVMGLGSIAQFKPEILDKFDQDRWADIYSDMLGVDPNLLVAGDQVVMIRQARDKAQAAEGQLAAMERQAKITRDLAGSPTGDMSPNALTDITNLFSGYQSPSAVEV